MVTEVTNSVHGCGETVRCKLLVPAHLGYTGRARWAIKPIDRCLAPQVCTLNAEGRLTASCCCAHGYGPGSWTHGVIQHVRSCQGRDVAAKRLDVLSHIGGAQSTGCHRYGVSDSSYGFLENSVELEQQPGIKRCDVDVPLPHDAYLEIITAA